MELDQFYNLLLLFRQFDPAMQISTVITLLEIAKAENEGREISTKDIQQILGLSNGAASRNIAYWAEGSDYMNGAHGFVKIEFGSKDRRKRSLRLTEKGKAFVRQLV